MLLATLAGLGGVLAFRTHPLPQVATTAATDTKSSSGSGGGSGTASGASTPPDSSASASSSLPPASGSATGQVVSTAYGPVQVKVTYSGSQITEVSALQLPTGNPQSDFINSQAGPLLREEALKAQSAAISGVSGASYTSAGYQSSLQSAVDQMPAGSGSSTSTS